MRNTETNKLILVMRKKCPICILVFLLLLTSRPALSQRFQFDEIEPDLKEIAIFVGYGENHRIPSATKDHFSLDAVKIRFGRFTSSRNEVALDISAGRFNTSVSNTALWATNTFRQFFFVRGGAAASWDIGFGIMHLQEKVSSLGTKTNFTEQLGFTFQYATGPATAISIEYKLYHVSNGGIRLPNIGINASLVSIGTSWYF
jgi:hypothetical protein